MQYSRAANRGRRRYRSFVSAGIFWACLTVLCGGNAAAGQHGRDATLTGRVVVVHGDDLQHGRVVGHTVYLQVGARHVRLPARASRYAGRMVMARGTVVGGRFTVTNLAALGGGTTSVASTAGSTPVTGPKRVAVILFNFSDDTSQPFTPASVAQTYFGSATADRSVAKYFGEVSWGNLDLSGQALGWYTIQASSATCDPYTWASQADRAAQTAGVDLAGFDYRTYVYPGVPACGWGGLGEMPGTRNWINGSPTAGIMAHELGHNLGLNHAVSETCTTDSGAQIAFGSKCTVSEYGDPFDVMGSASSLRHLNGWHRAMIGLTEDVHVVQDDGVYSLSTLEPQQGQPHVLRIPRGDGTSFDLEFRQPYGLFDNFDPSAAVVGGVLIHHVSGYSVANKPALLDATPETAAFADAALPVGRTFADPVTAITVKLLSVSPTGAQIEIHVRPGGDYIPPTVALASPVNGGSVTLPAVVQVAASDNLGISKVELYRNGRLYGTATSAPFSFAWADGQTGSYTLSAVAYDTTGISSVSPTITVSATQSDVSSPSTPLDVRSAENTQTTVRAVWAPSGDNVSVIGYQLFKQGVLFDSTLGTAYTFGGLTCGSSYVLSVAAVDAAGNVSPRRRLDAWTNACSGDTTSPTMPGALAAAATTPTSVRLAWQSSSDDTGVTAYRIDRDGAAVATVPGTSTSLTDFSAQPGASYRYVVTARDAAGNWSGTSEPVGVVMPAADTQPPSAPSAPSAVASGTSSIIVSWLPATDDVGVAGYRVYRDGVLVTTTTGTSFADWGLSSGTAYTYAITAFDTSGNAGPASVPVAATTAALDTQPPSAPGNVKAVALKGRKVRVSWSPATDNVGIAGYRVYRDGNLVGSLASSTLTFTDSPGRGSHAYTVRAFDAAGNTGPSSNSATLKV